MLTSQRSPHEVLHWSPEETAQRPYLLVKEEPLSIRVQGQPYSVVMRTPGEEISHAAGFCLGEGIVDALDDIGTLAFCDGGDTNVVTVTLTPRRLAKIAPQLDRRGYISQTSCGICGKQLVDEIHQAVTPLDDQRAVAMDQALECIESLPTLQPLRGETRASHAAAIFDHHFRLLAAAEDVGRHNALDKAIGKLFLEKRLEQAFALVLSSRISYELVQKSARARIPLIMAFSRPTDLAVQLATRLGITLACLAQQTGLLVFSHRQRLRSPSPE
jgi:FdhD protein